MLRKVLRSRATVAVVSAGLTALLVGGIAYAAQSRIDANGVIHACYNPTTGAMKLQTEAACPTKGMTRPISWPASGARHAELEFPTSGGTWTGGNVCTPTGWIFLGWGDCYSDPNTYAFGIDIDASSYPRSTVFRLRATVEGNGSHFCVRMYDFTVDAPVVGSDVCGDRPTFGAAQLISPPIDLPSGPHHYGVQGSNDGFFVEEPIALVADW